MNSLAIFHQPKSNYCYAYDENHVEIKMRAAKGDLNKVFLHYADKYAWDNKDKIQMHKHLSDDLYDYFKVAIKPPNNRLIYCFEIESEEKIFYFNEWGIIEEKNKNMITESLFHYPYVNKADIHRVPEWVKDSIFYQIFPERFFNGDPSINPENIQKWGEKPNRNSFFGGDLRGIIKKIDYLYELGINAIYLTPVFKSTTNHKYNTIDYLEIDPNFGDIDTMKELVNKCHQKGIKVLFDAVFNHSGSEFPMFKDVIEKGRDSIYADWFHVSEFPVTTNPLNYETFAFEPLMPKLNTENEEVIEYLLNVATYWIKECDIDGWRLDVADEVDHKFWRRFRDAVKKEKEDAYIVGEIWHDPYTWLRGDQFDATMNYPITKACTEYFAKNTINTQGFKNLISNTIVKNTRQVNEVMFNLLDSHDTARFLTTCNEHTNKLMMAEGFLLTFTGTTSIYYGTEIGMVGENDPDCRRTMDWNKDNWDLQLFEFYKKIIQIRKENDALKRGSFDWIDDLENVVGYVRQKDEEKIVVLINNSDKAEVVDIKDFNSKCMDLITNEQFDKTDDFVSVELKPYSIRILK
ncbi:alpha-glycosidase [Clostridiaceae bacterium M8S5]|nr:alpha-glycosidase [Clostridiaceae bacterium M8S5]